MEDILPPPAPRTVDSTPLFVSLYVVLLAFFIMLNGLAKVDHERANIVLQSVNHAFSNIENIASPQIMRSVGVELSATDFFNGVAHIARTELKLEKMSAQQSGNTMTISLPLKSLFAPGYTTPRRESRDFLEKLAGELVTPTIGTWIEVEWIVGAEGDAGDLEIGRAASLAEALADLDVPERTLSAGVRDHAGTDVQLVFNIRRVTRAGLPLVPLRPVGTLSQREAP